MNNIIPLTYEGRPVQFSADGWLNATKIAKSFGRDPYEWQRLSDTERYLEGLRRRYGEIPYVKKSRARADRGGGTWIHPKLAVKFARWLSVDFEIWCDEQIDGLLHGTQSSMDVFNCACKKLDDREALASVHGRGLYDWRQDKPLLISEVERGRNLLQMTLGLDRPVRISGSGGSQ